MSMGTSHVGMKCMYIGGAFIRCTYIQLHTATYGPWKLSLEDKEDQALGQDSLPFDAVAWYKGSKKGVY